MFSNGEYDIARQHYHDLQTEACNQRRIMKWERFQQRCIEKFNTTFNLKRFVRHLLLVLGL